MAIDFDAAPIPSWLELLLANYRAAVANTFILHGNVFDYVDHPAADLFVREYLSQRLRKTWTVVNYAPDTGITFPGLLSDAQKARARFERVVGMAPAELSETEKYLPSAAAAPPPEAPLPFLAAEALPVMVEYLARAKKQADGSERSVVIVDRLDLICPPADKGTMQDSKAALLSLLHRAGTMREINRNGALLILLAPSLAEVHPDLLTAASGIMSIAVPPPSHEDRTVYIERVLSRLNVTLEGTVAEFASATAGLTRRHIQDIALRAKSGETALPDGTVEVPGVITRALVRERKAEQMASEYADVLEVLEPTITLDQIGGHDLAKDYLREWVIGPLTSDDQEIRALIPLGLAFLGPGGTGKTVMAQAVGQATGLNMVLLRAENIKGGIVGESERRLAKAIVGIEALAPCVVFVDEIDQKFRRAEGGSGGGGDAVEMNQFGRLLEFFGDTSHRGSILVIAASNRPDLVDAALFRAGRFDTKIPLLPPDSAQDRADVMASVLRRRGALGEMYDGATRAALMAAGEVTDGWTQAELERLCIMALSVMKIRRTSLVEALTQARGRMKASTREIARMTRLALAECDDLSLVPERWRAAVGVPAPAEGTAAAEEAEMDFGPRTMIGAAGGI